MTKIVGRNRAIRTAATRLLPGMVEANARDGYPSTGKDIVESTVVLATMLIDELDKQGYTYGEEEGGTGYD